MFISVDETSGLPSSVISIAGSQYGFVSAYVKSDASN